VDPDRPGWLLKETIQFSRDRIVLILILFLCLNPRGIAGLIDRAWTWARR